MSFTQKELEERFHAIADGEDAKKPNEAEDRKACELEGQLLERVEGMEGALFCLPGLIEARDALNEEIVRLRPLAEDKLDHMRIAGLGDGAALIQVLIEDRNRKASL